MLSQLYRLIFVSSALVFSTSSAAMAGIVDRVDFSVRPTVVSHVLETQSGVTKILVSSNTPFKITSEGFIGAIQITVQQSGEINGLNFGSASHLPGPSKSETFAMSPMETPIYRSERRTAGRSGSPLEQAVLVEISYAHLARPNFSVKPKL